MHLENSFCDNLNKKYMLTYEYITSLRIFCHNILTILLTYSRKTNNMDTVFWQYYQHIVTIWPTPAHHIVFLQYVYHVCQPLWSQYGEISIMLWSHIVNILHDYRILKDDNMGDRQYCHNVLTILAQYCAFFTIWWTILSMYCDNIVQLGHGPNYLSFKNSTFKF